MTLVGTVMQAAVASTSMNRQNFTPVSPAVRQTAERSAGSQRATIHDLQPVIVELAAGQD